MKQETINLFIGLILGFFLCLICIAAIKVHVIDPKQKEIMDSVTAKQAYYEEICRTKGRLKYFVQGPMMVVFLDQNIIWDPNQIEAKP